MQRSEDGVDYDVSRFRPIIETDFSIVERWTRSSDGDEHWRVVTRDAKVTQFGTGPDSRIADPADPRRVFSWLPATVTDAKGNRILYEYRAEDEAAFHRPRRMPTATVRRTAISTRCATAISRRATAPPRGCFRCCSTMATTS